MNIENIKDNTLIICENAYKENILKKMSLGHLFLNVKFLTKKEFLEKYLFKVSDEGLYFIVNKYNIKIDIAKMYLDNLYYIQDKKYNNRKLDFLVEILNTLKENNLIIYDDSFKNFLKGYNLLVLGYNYLETFEENIFQSLNANIINNIPLYEINKVYEFVSIEDEIEYTLKEISKLLENKVDINNIKITGINEEYYIPLSRIAKFYNIPINIPKSSTLYSNPITKEFLKYYASSLEEAYNNIKDKNPIIVNKIINIVNKYTFEEDKLKVKDFIINDFKKAKINNFNLKNYVEILDLNYPYEDEYVFLLNLNMGSIPYIVKDESYITDNIKDLTGMKKVNVINKEIKESIINKIKSIKNLSLSYKKKSNNSNYYASPIINDLHLEIINPSDDITCSYSSILDKLKYASSLDAYNKYGTLNDNINAYKSAYNIPYKEFNNKFKGINPEDLKVALKGELKLSYSTLNNYSKCAFRYYLANILHIDKYEDKFEAFIGSIFHDVLENCLTGSRDVETEVESYIKKSNRQISIKEKFFINKVKEDIKFTVDALKEKASYITMDKALYEQNIIIDKSTNDLKRSFIGFVDKIIYEENTNHTLVSIIDYKTGYVDIELKYLEYGLSMQLPIYLYLVKKGNLFNNPIFVGFYLQMILNKEFPINPKKSYEEQRKDSLKLNGYSIDDKEYLERFDSSYEHSNLIKSMAVKNDGNFYSYTKVLSSEDIDKIIDLTEGVVNNTLYEITKGNFPINPKKIGNNNVGCEFCKFKDICYKTENDFVLLEEKDKIDFLGGESDAKVD